ncbi:hypothetical protein [Streptococcus sp. P25B114]
MLVELKKLDALSRPVIALLALFNVEVNDLSTADNTASTEYDSAI